MDQSCAIRVGVVVPLGNVVHEREFNTLRPEGVQFQFAEFANPVPAAGRMCADLTANLVRPIAALKEWGAQVVLLGCTTASMLCAGESFLMGLEQIAGIPIVTAATAARDAMRALALKSVAVATPYGPAGNAIIAGFIAGQGIEVSAIAGMALDATAELWLAEAPRLTPQQILAFAAAVDVEPAQGMYMPCTAINSLEALQPFEDETGKPALSSVQAGYWATLRRIGFDGRGRGHGRLLEQWNF